MGKFDLDVTTLQLSVLYCWNDRPHEQLSFECLRTATQLSVPELVRTLYVSLWRFDIKCDLHLCTVYTKSCLIKYYRFSLNQFESSLIFVLLICTPILSLENVLLCSLLWHSRKCDIKCSVQTAQL